MAEVRKKGGGPPLGSPLRGREASFASIHFSELGWGGSSHLETPKRDQSHVLDLNKLIFPQLATILAAPGLQNYFLQCVAPMAAPQLTPFSAWALRHEYHLQHLALTLAQRAVGTPQPRIPLSTSPIPHYLHPAFLASNRPCRSCLPPEMPYGIYPLCLYPHPHFSALSPLNPLAPCLLSTGSTPGNADYQLCPPSWHGLGPAEPAAAWKRAPCP